MSSKAAAWSRWQMPSMLDSEPAFRSDGRADSRVETHTEVARSLSEADVAACREEARRAGWEQGLSEGRQAARGELRLHAERWQHLVEHLQQPLAALNQQVEQELAELALAIARQVVREQLDLHPENILGVVREAVAALPSAARQLRLHLHPEDAHLVAESLPGLSEASWQIIEDAGIARGGCLLESGSTRVDARVETRLAEAADRLDAADDSHLRAVM